MTRKIIQKYHLLILLGIIAILMAFGILRLSGFVGHYNYINIPLHSSIEAIGAVMFILIAILIFIRTRGDTGELDFPLIAMGFLGMGIFDLYHSFLHVGNNFVLAHILSLLNGGFWFMLLFLPKKVKIIIRHKSFPFVSVGVWLMLLVLLTTNPNSLPMLEENGTFTFLSYIHNTLAGVGFIAGTIYLILRYRKEFENELFLLAIIALIQGLSCITFYQSEVWDIEWWLWHIYRFVGSIILFYSVFVMYRKMMEELGHINKNQSTIVNAMPFGLMIVSKDKKVIQLNKAARQLTGFENNEVYNQPCFDSICKAECNKCPVLDQKENVEGKKVIIGKKDGTSFPALKTVKQIKFNNEEVLLEGFVDLTEMVRAEEELRLGEKKFKEIFDSVTNSIFIIDFEEGIIEVNKTALEQYGYSKEEFLKMSPPDFIHPDYLHEFDRFMKEVTETGKFKGETIDIKKDGSKFYTDVSGSLVTFNGKPHILASVRDITIRKKAEKKLKNAMMDLERSNKDLEQFAYVSSHDLQEPLRKIKNYSDLLVIHSGDKLDEKGKKYLDIISRGAMRMQKLIDDLLGISRVSNEVQEFAKVNVNDLVQDVCKSLKKEILNQKAEVIYKDLPEIIGNEKQLFTLFENLLSNALKFTNNTSTEITIGCEELESDWLFSVKDNGIGFDMKYAEKIFVIFQILHARNEYVGTGIGLAISKKIVERHGGKIWAESQPGKGSVFYFKLPK